jgi:hypothetical protein
MIAGMIFLPGLLQAKPITGLELGRMRVSPWAELQATHDSNVGLTETDELSDYSVSAKIGVEAVQKSDKLLFVGQLWGLSQSYDKLSAEDHEDFGQLLNIDLGSREYLQGKLRQEYLDLDNLDPVTGSIEGRKRGAISAGVGRAFGEKIEIDLMAGYTSLDYDAPWLFDWEEQRLDLRAGYNLTDKSMLFLDGIIGNQESDANVNDADYFTTHLGYAIRGTEKLNASIGVGFTEFDADSDFSIFSYDAQVNWMPSEKIFFSAALRDYIQPAIQNQENYIVFTDLAFIGEWRITQSYSVSLTQYFVNNDYEEDVEVDGVALAREEDRVGTRARASYISSAEFLEIYVQGEFENRDSTLSGGDYDRTLFSVGAVLNY